MLRQVLFYIGGALPFIWGIAHLFPTKSVVKGFGEISADNRRIITMEWIIEGVALIFVGLLVIAVTYYDVMSRISLAVYLLSAILLVTLAIISLMTGAKIKFIPFRLCPVIFAVSALLILLGVYLQV